MIIAFYTQVEQHHEKIQLPSLNFIFQLSPAIRAPAPHTLLLLPWAGPQLVPQNTARTAAQASLSDRLTAYPVSKHSNKKGKVSTNNNKKIRQQEIIFR